MREQDKIKVASIAVEKQFDFDELFYSDYMKGKEEFTEDVWKYVQEYKEKGLAAFYKKYNWY